FVLGGHVVWRADRWLGPAKPMFNSGSPIQRIFVGLDRVYVRTSTGTHYAFDPRTGARLDLGAWPSSPHVSASAAADGWRAVAVTDLRGAVATFAAGATWQPLALPIEPREVTVVGDALAVGGPDAQRTMEWFEVRPDGHVGRIAGITAA